MFNKQSFKKNSYQLTGKFARQGYDWWWHSFTAIDHETKEEVPFFVEFFIINPEVSKDKVILGQSKENKGLKPSYLMVKCGCWGKNKVQLHNFYPLKDVEIKSCPIEIKVGDNLYLSENKLKGDVRVDEVKDGMMCDKGHMVFHLTIDKKIAFNVGYGTSNLFRALKAFEMYWHAQGMKSLFSGQITLNERRYDVIPKNSYGYADKNWGSNFTTPWLWLSSNKVKDHETGEILKNTVFDIGGGKPKAFGITFKDKLLGAYYIEGKEYQYNFSKFWHPSKTQFSFKVENDIAIWNVIQEDKVSKIETNITCKTEDMLFVNYEDPLGCKKHNKLYNGGNGKGSLDIYEKKNNEFVKIRTIDVENVGCEYGEFDKEIES